MQRVSAFLPSWDKRHSGHSKTGGGLFGWGHRHGANASRQPPSSINVAAANAVRVQREAFWPASLDVECDKAARILKSFCADGYLAPCDAEAATSRSSMSSPPQTPVKVPKKIPKRIIQNAAGIAVFTCMRSGLWMTGSGGSGILIARKSDGTWSPPSGILLHTPTLSFIIGVDIYDCVLVINNLAALETITRPRVTLGEDVGLTNGPSVPLDSDEVHIRCRELGNTVLAYMKARGQHQAVNLHGCILTERTNENERFYESDVTQMDILAGNVARHVQETKPLFEVIKMAEGRSDFDAAVISRTAILPAPGDAMIATPKPMPASAPPLFGIPKEDDPDPYGVLALEMAGLEIREAGTRLRPTSSQFECNSTPLSPSLSKLSRQSVETFVTRSNRASVMSSRTVKSQVTDACTQTDVANTPETTPSPGQSDDGQGRASIDKMPELKEDTEIDYTRIDLAPLRHLSQEHSIGAVLVTGTATAEQRHMKSSASAKSDDDDVTKAATASSIHDRHRDEEEETNDADDEDDLNDDEEPVVIEVAAVQPASARAIASRAIQARGNMVTISKRAPPPLPMRSPARSSRSSKSDVGGELVSVRSPLRQTFSDTDSTAEKDTERSALTETKADEFKDRECDIDENSTIEAEVDALAARGPSPIGEAQPKSLTPQDVDTEVPVTVEAEAEETPVSGAPAEEPKDVEEETGHSEVELKAEEPGSAGTDTERAETYGDTGDRRKPEAKAEEAIEERSNGEDANANANESPHEQTDNSDSTTHEKHTSSIYTGATEDRWSCDGSSLTTPTSERRYSMAEDTIEQDTPTKIKEVEEAVVGVAQQPSSEPKMTVPRNVTAA